MAVPAGYEKNVEVEFPNLRPEGDSASPIPVIPDPGQEHYERQPLNDAVDDRNNTYSIEEFLRRKENPKAIDVPPPARGNKIAEIPDYSHLANYGVPDYSHLIETPKTKEYDTVIKQAEEMQKSIWTDPQYYPLIKKFMETGDPIDAFKAAAAITMLTFGAAPRGSVGSSGGEPPKPPYFKKPANDNTDHPIQPIKPPTESELMTAGAVMQRMQQQAQALRQEAIKSGKITEKGSPIKELESSLSRLKLDREAHEVSVVLSKSELRELDKEIASVEQLIEAIKIRNPGSVVPIDIKEMQSTKSQEPQAGPRGRANWTPQMQNFIRKIDTVTEDGTRKSAKQLVKEFRQRYPEYPGSDATIQSMTSRLRLWKSLNKEDNIFTPDVVRDQKAKSGDTISKPLGQGEFDFNAPIKPSSPVPDIHQANREMLFARDSYATYNQSILKGSATGRDTLEELRLRSLFRDRTKELRSTLMQIEKDKRTGDLLGRQAREYLEGRAQAQWDQIRDLKRRIWGTEDVKKVIYSAVGKGKDDVKK